MGIGINSPLKIGYLMQQDVDIMHAPFDGPAVHVREVVQSLMARGHEVRVVMRLRGRIWRTDDLDNFEMVTVRWMDKGLLRLFESIIRRIQFELRLPYASLFESVRFALACCQVLHDFDLLYERMSWGNFGGALAAKRCDIPLVLENNGDHLLDLEMKNIAPTGLQRWVSTQMMKRTVHAADHSITSGEGWRRQYIGRWEIDSGRVTTIENGTTLVGSLQRNDLRSFSEQDSEARPVNLIYLGGFYPWHGIPVLLQALAAVLRDDVKVNLTAIGSGPGSDTAIELVRDLNLTTTVTFTGQLATEEYAPLLAQADIGVAPYCEWPEYSGLKIFDYKAAGLATIASGENGQPSSIAHGKTGLIVPPCDVGALCEAIHTLTTDIGFRRTLGRTARLEAESLHRWDQTARNLETVFSKVLLGSNFNRYTTVGIETEESFSRS